MRILVTGGAGFIGSNFVRYWVERHPADHVVAYDALTYAGNRPNLADVEDRITFVHGDVCDLDLACDTLRDRGIDTVVHFAAESHNSPGRPRPCSLLPHQRARDPDHAGGQPAARDVGRFHHISTCEVYGDLALDSDERFTEDSPYRPRTPYNASKAGADHAVRAYFETFELPVTITNCCNNYGPYQFPEKVIPLFVTHALEDQPLTLYASTQNRREWLHVVDHCRAVEAVLQRGDPRRDLPRGQRDRGQHRGPRRPGARGLGQAGHPQEDRARPARTRPAVPARLLQDHARAGLGGGDRLRPKAWPRRCAGTPTTANWWHPLRRPGPGGRVRLGTGRTLIAVGCPAMKVAGHRGRRSAGPGRRGRALGRACPRAGDGVPCSARTAPRACDVDVVAADHQPCRWRTGPPC